MSTREHVHAASFAALLARETHGRSKSDVSRELSMTPANLREFETGVRSGARPLTRDRLAQAVAVDHRNVITCWCDRPDGRCRSLEVPS